MALRQSISNLRWIRARTIAICVAVVSFEVVWFVDAWAFIGLWAAFVTVAITVALAVAVVRTQRAR